MHLYNLVVISRLNMPADTHIHVIHLKNHIFAYICIVVCRILDSEYVAIAVESVEMGGGGEWTN